MSPIEPRTRADDAHLFDDTRGFFRARTATDIRAELDALVVPGPPLDHDAANRLARRFVDVLTDGRPTDLDLPDALEHAERNNLLLLFGPGEQDRFERLYARMPDDMVVAWRAALRGGDPRDAFGPLTAAERLDAKRIDQDMRAGRRQRLVQLVAGLVVLVAVVGGLLWWRGRGGDDAVDAGSISFGATPDRGSDLRGGPAPVVEKALVARLDRAVAVRAGQGDVASRIVLDPPAAALPQPAGAVAATLFRYNGSGQVVLVGPPGWLTKACIQVSVVSASLRAFDTAYTETAPGACAAGRAFGRVATVGCRDPKAATTMLDLVIPEGQVALAEGGNGSVAGVRITLVGAAAGFERVDLTADLVVAGGTTVKVPSFGGAKGATVSFDVSAATGAPLVGSCALT